MCVKPIGSEADYEKMPHRVEELWRSEAGSPEGDELDVLVSLTETYEREHHPIDLPISQRPHQIFRPAEQRLRIFECLTSLPGLLLHTRCRHHIRSPELWLHP